MKRLLFSLLFTIFSTTMFSQSADLLIKAAKKNLNIYTLDNSNTLKLEEARKLIDMAEDDSEVEADPDMWILRGDIYNTIATRRNTATTLGVGQEILMPDLTDPSFQALQAFKKAMSLADKKSKEKAVVDGLQIVQRNISAESVRAYDNKNYDQAYLGFKGVIDAHKLLASVEAESTLDDPDDYKNQVYLTGLAALNADRTKKAKEAFLELYRSDFDKPSMYEALYKITSLEDGLEDGYLYLKKGRELFPDDTGLLFADINYHLKNNMTGELIGLLNEGIEKEPENTSLVATLANVYDNLFQKEMQEENMEGADMYFDKAASTYNQLLQAEPDNFDGNYGMGALYYNKAALATRELVDLSDDFSEEGMKKYDEVKEKVYSLFDQALPYFQKAESLNPNNISTLIALREIYVKKNDIDMVKEFKSRLENVMSGATNESFFKE